MPKLTDLQRIKMVRDSVQVNRLEADAEYRKRSNDHSLPSLLPVVDLTNELPVRIDPAWLPSRQSKILKGAEFQPNFQSLQTLKTEQMRKHQPFPSQRKRTILLRSSSKPTQSPLKTDSEDHESLTMFQPEGPMLIQASINKPRTCYNTNDSLETPKRKESK